MVCLLVACVSSARAVVYLDATNDLFAGANAQQLDIVSVVVTNDASNLYFTINVVGNPILTNWGSYAIAFVTGPGGATNGNGSGAAISLTEGINYWVTCLGWGDQAAFKYNTSTSSWVTNNAAITFANSSRSVSLTVPYASMGLTNGVVFQFDVYTFSGTGGAMDDLADPVPTIYWWSDAYTNNLVETYPLPNSSGPAAVTWQSVRAVADSIDVDTNGTPLLAAYWSGSAGSNTLNGVAFMDSGSYTQSQNGVTAAVTGDALALMMGGDLSADGGFFGTTSRAAQGAGPNGANYAALLGGGAYSADAGGSTTLTLSGLTTGHQYRVQFWVYDSRYTNNATETLSGSGSDTNVPTLARRNVISPNGIPSYNRNGGSFVIGSFTAAASTQSFTVQDTSSSGPQVNAFQLRDVTGVTVPPPSPYSPAQAVGTAAYVGSAFTYFTNLGAYFYGATNFGAIGLPPGLSLNATSGVISGTPSDAGLYFSTISGICAGVTYQATMLFVIAPPEGAPRFRPASRAAISTMFPNPQIIRWCTP